MQATAGNTAVTRLLQRNEHPPVKEPRKPAPDQFLLTRWSTFHVSVYADRYVVTLDRKQYPWHAGYSEIALGDVALVALVKHVYTTAPDPQTIYAKRLELAKQIGISGTGNGDDRPPPEVSPLWLIQLDGPALALMATELDLDKLTGAGAELQHRRELGTWLNGVLAGVARRWGSIRPALDQEKLKRAKVSEAGLFAMLSRDEGRRALVQVAAGHDAARAIVAAYGLREVPTLTEEQWATLLVALAGSVSERVREAYEKRRSVSFWKMGPQRLVERVLAVEVTLLLPPVARRRRAGAALRRVHARIDVENVPKFSVAQFDPTSEVVIDFVGPLRLSGGMRITNVKNQTLQILSVSPSGAIAAEQMKDIVPMTQFIMRVTGALFPPVGYVYTASTIISVAGKIYQARAELERLYDNLLISRRNIETVAPGLLRAALPAGVSGAVAAFFDSRNVQPALDEFLIAALKLARRIASNVGEGKFGPEIAVTALETLWVSVKAVAAKVAAVAFYANTLTRPVLASAGGGRQDPQQADHLTDLAHRLAVVGITNAAAYARALLAASSTDRELLIRELEEFKRNGTDLVAALKEATSW